MKVVIIGGNAAGMSAAARLKRKSPDAQVVVYEATNEVSYGACGLPYYVAGLNNNLDLMRIRKPESFRESGIELHLSCKVDLVDFVKRTVSATDSSGSRIDDTYDKLLIASGSSATVPPVPNVGLDGVFTLKTLSDGEAIRGKLMDEKTKNIVIIGGGYIGLEIVEACLLQKGKHVTLIEALDNLLSTFDGEFGEAAKAMLAKNGVDIRTGERLTGFAGDARLSGVCTDKGKYDADLAIVAIGVRPNTAFLQDIDKLPNGAIVTDAAMQTSVADVYAAGDCSTVCHALLNKPVFLPLGTNANKQGRLVADAIMGKPVRFQALGTSMLRCMDLEFAKTGLGEKEAQAAGIAIKTVTVEARTHARYFPSPYPITIKLCCQADTKVILGAQIMGQAEAAWRIDVFACAVDRGMTASELGFLDLGYAPPYASVWDAIQIAANALK